MSASKMARPLRSNRLRRVLLCASLLALAGLGSVGTSAALALGGWSAPTPIDPGNSLSAVSCGPGTAVCAAVDGAGNAFAYQGSAWGLPESVGLNFHSVSCPSSILCMAGGEAGKVSKRSSGAWTPLTSDASRTVTGMSCASNFSCVAVDAGGFALTWKENAWGLPASIASGRAVNSVSCTGTAACVAVDSGGYALTYDGSGWSAPAQIDAGHGLTSVSCQGTTCVAVDNAGNFLRSSSGVWTSPQSIDAGRALTSVSCPSAAKCTAVDTAGNALTFDGLTWSAPVNVDPGHALNSVSCPSPSFCMAVDDAGNALTYPRSAAEIEAEEAAKRAEEAAARAAQEAAAKAAAAAAAAASAAAVPKASGQGSAHPQGLAKCVSAAKLAFGKDKKKAERRHGKARADALRSARKKKQRRTAACTRQFS